MSKKNTSPKSKGEKIQQTKSPQKNPNRKYMLTRITSPISKGKIFQQNNSPQKNPKRK